MTQQGKCQKGPKGRNAEIYLGGSWFSHQKVSSWKYLDKLFFA